MKYIFDFQLRGLKHFKFICISNQVANYPLDLSCNSRCPNRGLVQGSSRYVGVGGPLSHIAN